MAQTKLGSFKGTGKAGLPQKELYEQAGIDIKTGQPTRLVEGSKIDVLPLLRIIDEQDFCNTFKREEFPAILTSREIERLIYYYHDLMFFQADDDEFYLMPYVLDGNLDYYSRFKTVHPVPLTDGKEGEENEEKKVKTKENKNDTLTTLLATMKRDVIYTKNQLDGITDLDPKKYCVLLFDYTHQRAQINKGRWMLADDILKLEASVFSYLDLAMLTSSGIKGMRVPDANAKVEIMAGAMTLRQNVKQGIPYVAITSPLEFQDLGDGPTAKINEYFLALQSLDNFRLQTLGVDNLGVYEKGSHLLESENNLNQSKNSYILEDRLENRQQFCELVNLIFKKNTSVHKNEDFVPSRFTFKDTTKDGDKKQQESFEEESYE